MGTGDIVSHRIESASYGSVCFCACVCKAGLMVLFSRHTPEDRAHVQNGTEDLQCVSV